MLRSMIVVAGEASLSCVVVWHMVLLNPEISCVRLIEFSNLMRGMLALAPVSHAVRHKALFFCPPIHSQRFVYLASFFSHVSQLRNCCQYVGDLRSLVRVFLLAFQNSWGRVRSASAGCLRRHIHMPSCARLLSLILVLCDFACHRFPSAGGGF